MAGGKKHQTAPESSDLIPLIQRKAKIVENITRIKKSIMEKNISFNPYEIDCRLEILKDYIANAMTLQSEIEIIEPTNNDRADLEDLCVSTKSLLLSLQNRNTRSSFGDNSLIQTHQSRLPNMRLPKFSGKYSEFKNFMSLFENLIHNDPTLTDIEKFNHLMSCLSDEALGTVKAFQISEENYPKALASLKKVYDNDCLIFLKNISKLFDLPEINKPSAPALRNMIDTVSALYDSLLSIGDDKKISNAILIHLVMSKVDPLTKSKWEEQLDFEKLPLWSDCEAMLNRRYQHIAADESSDSRNRNFKNRTDYGHKKNIKTSLGCIKTKKSIDNCLFCKSVDHKIYNCSNFSTLPVIQRFDFIKGVPACINCLKKGHTVSRCNAQKCRVCNLSHHQLLHRYECDSQVARGSEKSSHDLPSDQPSTSRASVNHTGSEENIILATAVVKVKTVSGQYVLARALLDSGSQANLITEDLAQKIRIRRETARLDISLVGEMPTLSKSRVELSIMSRVNSYEITSKFWIMKSITGVQPDTMISRDGWSIPENIILADPRFDKPQRVDMLIGGGYFFDLLSVGQIRVASDSSFPILQKTMLGWIVVGRSNGSNKYKSNIFYANSVVENEELVDSVVRKFWEMESLPNERIVVWTEEQRKCEEVFINSVRRLPSGRFSVSLPFKSNPNILGSSYETAKRRFLSLERKLSTDGVMREMYHSFMNEYLNLGHMSAAGDFIPDYPHYFIPHQCVLRPQSTSTKLRVVFDASCRTSSGKSLNDLLMVGPTVQEDLYSTLIRFRFHKFVITADIKQMYRQVLINEDDRQYQLILYRKNPSEQIQTFRLNTVTYGTSSAPFLAIRCLTYLSQLYKETWPIGANVIQKDFYVDDLLTGGNSYEDIISIRDQVTEILEAGGFHLTKWVSNHSNFKCADGSEILLYTESDSAKTLGIQWIPKNDTFKFHLDNNFHELKATKRNILSVASRLFDPLGLLCPLVTRSKMFLQELWIQKLDWDESIPMHMNSSWSDFKSNLSQLDSIQIPRFVHTSFSSVIQIHGFADASIRAYGCCIYVRSFSEEGVFCRLLTAKSKVAPLKTKSMPRLELCAAHLLAKLWNRIEKMLSFRIEKVVFWTDSEITLHWIRTHPSTLSTFVSNRVAEIQEWSDRVDWRHVPGKQNPADIVSRGSNVAELNESIWFCGPSFLLKDETDWPVNNHFDLTEGQKLLETKKSKILVAIGNQSKNYILEMVQKHSSFNKIMRIMCYVLRFIDSLKKYKISENKIPGSKEMKWAFYRISEVIQREYFSEEIQKLQKSLLLPSNIQKLTPFMHNFTEGKRNFSLMRVGGRLLNAPLAFNTKFPILLPKKTFFVTCYLRDLHMKNCHAGTRALISLSRENVWIINARDECKKVVRDCVHCFRYKPKLMTQVMGNLPADRLRALRPFLIVGVDFCGPVNVSLRIRGRPPLKMYLAVFVCFSSKAIHIELVSDLTTDAFILSFKRFSARRGLPSKVYCDNATNFVGASRVIQERYQAFVKDKEAVEFYGASCKVEFIFIPPRAPHFGGLWEAAVKQAKFLLLRAVGNASLTQEEMQTMLAEVEAVLNSRPIAPLSPDPNDGEALTPAHLLIGEGLRSLPPESAGEDNSNKVTCLRRWRMLCDLKQKFWKSWSKDYVLELQHKVKWNKEETNIQEGQVVVVHEDNLPPREWLTGVVVNVVKGQDGKVRVAEVKTKNGIFKRPITKLAPLPNL